jgi:hypothetical protein
MKKLVLTVSLFVFALTVNAQITGNWKGTLSFPGLEMDFVIHISETDGVYSSTIDVSAQGVAGLPVETTFENDQLTLSADQFQIAYKGMYLGKTIKGNLIQSGMPIPLDLNKLECKSNDEPAEDIKD